MVKAFLTHDLATLKQHCGPELMERLEGIFKHFEGQVGGGNAVLLPLALFSCAASTFNLRGGWGARETPLLSFHMFLFLTSMFCLLLVVSFVIFLFLSLGRLTLCALTA